MAEKHKKGYANLNLIPSIILRDSRVARVNTPPNMRGNPFPWSVKGVGDTPASGI